MFLHFSRHGTRHRRGITPDRPRGRLSRRLLRADTQAFQRKGLSAGISTANNAFSPLTWLGASQIEPSLRCFFTRWKPTRSGLSCHAGDSLQACQIEKPPSSKPAAWQIGFRPLRRCHLVRRTSFNPQKEKVEIAVASGAFLVLTSGAVERGGTGMVPGIPAFRMLFFGMRQVYQLLFQADHPSAVDCFRGETLPRDDEAPMHDRQGRGESGCHPELSMPVVIQPRHRDHFSRTLRVSCNTPALEVENEGELA